MRRFWKDTRGHIAVIFGLALPALVATMGAAVDYTAWTAQSRKLQAIADISAMAAAKELYLANANAGQITSVAASVADAQLALDNTYAATLTVSSQVINDGQSVEVTVSQPRETYFSHLFAPDFGPLTTTAVARLAGGGRLCVLALDEDASPALYMKQFGQVTAPTCAVYSNATSVSGIEVRNKAEVAAELICSAGGVYGTVAAFTPSATTDCPQIPDPLASRPSPTVGSCDYNNLDLDNGADTPLITLYPGVYCGGLQISNGTVFLEPGIYVMKDGGMRIDAGAAVSGENVGFYFVGDLATFDLASNSTVNLTAPDGGPLAGILFFEDRSAPLGRRYTITSNRAQILLGTIYLSRGELFVNSNAPVADNSAWTAVIVNSLSVVAKSNLVLNTGYNQTDIPVPPGVANTGGSIVLER